MARNASGTYALPSGNPVVAGTTITDDWANDTMNDVAVEMTDSLNRSGKGGMLAALELLAGSIGTPGLSFSAETDLGMYRKAAATLGFSDAAADLLVLIAASATFSGKVVAGGDTAAGDNAAMGYTAAEGLVLTGQGSTNDITIKNDADVNVMTVATGLTSVLFGGNIALLGTVEPQGAPSTGDNAAVGYSSANGLILTGQGSTNDITLKNDADAVVARVPTGTNNLVLAGDLTVSGNIVGGNLESVAEQASTSGTTVDFTGIPSWVKRITIIFDNVSIDGTEELLVQIGDSGGLETTGYVSTCSRGAGGQQSTAGFIVSLATDGTDQHIGTVVLNLMDATTFKWVSAGTLADFASQVGVSGGVKSLSSTLTLVTITTTGTPDDFDGGSISLMYE